MATSNCAEGVKHFACGQLVALFSMASLIMAKYLTVHDANVPALMNLVFYSTLGLGCLGFSFARRWWQSNQQQAQAKNATTPLSSPLGLSPVLTPVNDMSSPTAKEAHGALAGYVPWWMYPVVACLDVEANFCAVRALVYTDYVTAALMLNLAIPFISFLYFIITGRKYSRLHIAGCGIALTGGVVLFIGSYSKDQQYDMSHQVYGCFLALMAAVLFAASNIANQLCMKSRGMHGSMEAMGCIGLWAAAIALLHVLLFELDVIRAIYWDENIFVSLAGYAMAMVGFYVLISIYADASASTTYSLSLLSANIYLPFASYYLFVEVVPEYFGAALALVLLGLGLHSVEDSQRHKPNGESSIEKGDIENGSKPTTVERAKSLASFNSLTTPRDGVQITVEQAVV